uniref:Ionotropic glutamate receptor C-terminal domain-containing protein n=1 Tax=Bigelowiella natans TaxID=227086 RepID=A0A6T7GEM9_BIGNA|mmetsp:Transcript_1114/g.1721  ORF Transcript_1114/g.1721 Transcript_1114/m.1721 type:complete len:473 (+) Transcript_1114:292-1710(+)
MWIVEGWTNDEDYPHDTNTKNFMSSLFYSFQSFFGNGDYRWNPHTLPGRLALTALGVFTLIVLTTYTGMVTTILLRREDSGQIRSLTMAMQQEKKICILEANLESVGARYDIYALAVPVASAREALPKMDANECHAALLTEDEWNAARAGLYDEGDKSKHCNKLQTGDIVYTIVNAIPVRQDLQPAISWAISKELAQGTYVRAEQEAKKQFLPPSQCVDDFDDEENVRSLGLSEMMGAMIIAFVGCTGSILMFLCKEELRGNGCCYKKVFCKRKLSRVASQDGFSTASDDDYASMIHRRKTASYSTKPPPGGGSVEMTSIGEGKGSKEGEDDVETANNHRRRALERTASTRVAGMALGSGGRSERLAINERYLAAPSLAERFFGFSDGDPRQPRNVRLDNHTLNTMARLLYGRKRVVKGTCKFLKSDSQLKVQDVPMLIDLISEAVVERSRPGNGVVMNKDEKNAKATTTAR